MALSLAGLLIPGVEIGDPQVVTKSYPGFFETMSGLGGRSVFYSAEGTELAVGEGESGIRAWIPLT